MKLFRRSSKTMLGVQSLRSTSLSTYIAEEQEIISICEYQRTYATE